VQDGAGFTPKSISSASQGYGGDTNNTGKSMSNLEEGVEGYFSLY